MPKPPTTNEDILRAFEKHIQDDQDNFGEIKRVLFGNKETGEMGMKEKQDAIYDILMQARGVGRFFGGVKGLITFLIAVGAFIAMFKGWFGGN